MSRRKNRVIFDSDSSENESSNSDLDSEFLNLAKKKNGKADATKKSAKASAAKPKKIFAPVFSDTETSSGSDADWSYSNSNKKKKKKKKKPKKVAKKAVKKRHNVDSDDDDEEEFEETVTTTKKKQPAKKKGLADLEEGEVEDSGSNDDSGEEFDDGYDEHLMGDDEDRERLAKMTEKEREQEIYKRIEAREVMKARFEIEKKLRKAKRQELKLQKKQQQENNGPDEKQLDLKERVQERKKMVEVNRGRADKKVHAMNLLKERREQKKEREEKEKQNKIEEEKLKEEQKNQKETDGKLSSNKRLRMNDVYTDDSDSETDEKKKKLTKIIPRPKVVSSSASSRSSSDSDSDSRSKRRKVQYIDSCEELNNIRLSRHKLERFVHLPIFRDIAVGCYVRVGLGTIKGDPIYRAGEIIDVCETAKIYQLGNTRTNKGLRVRHGSHERVFRLEFISNQEFTHNEFMRLKEYCLAKHVPMPTVDHMEKKMTEMKNAYYYEFKEEEVDQMVKEKGRFKILPYNFAMKKTQLIQDRDNAQLRGDDDKATEIQKQIVELEEKANELDKIRTSTISSISYINNRNRRKNVEEAEKAIMAEVQANKGQRRDDPFTRRHTKPCMIFRKPRTTEIEPEEATDTTDNAFPSSAKKNENKKFDPKDNDLFSAHNFDITIDFNEPLPNSFFTSLNSFRQQHEQQQLLQQQQQQKKKTS